MAAKKSTSKNSGSKSDRKTSAQNVQKIVKQNAATGKSSTTPPRQSGRTSR